MFDLNEKVALVTGGAQGIGSSIVKELLRNNLKAVAILDVNEAAAKKAVEEIELEFGLGKVLFVKADVGVRSEFENALKEAICNFEHLDIIVNNAGVVCERDWEKEIMVNLTGTVNGTVLGFESYLSEHKSGDEGVILNIASVLAFHHYRGCPIYAATKSGVVALTRAMGQPEQYRRKHVRIMAVCPGFTKTDMSEVKREKLIEDEYLQFWDDYFKEYPTIFQTPEEIAKVAINVIKKGENGSIWIAKNKKDAYEVEILSCNQMKKIKL